MKKLKIRIVLLLLLLLLMNLTLVKANSEDLDLPESVLIALSGNLQVMSYRIDREEKKELLELARIAGDEDLVERFTEELEQAETTLINAKKQLISSIESTYFSILQDEDQLKVQKEALEGNWVQLQAYELRYEAGEISNRDITMSRNNYQDLKKAYEDAIKELSWKKKEFNHLLGQDLEEELVLKRSVEFQELELEVEEAYQLALLNREEILRAREAILEAKERLKQIDNPFHAPVEITQAKNKLLKEKISLKELETSLFFEIHRAYQGLLQAYEGIEKANMDLAMQETELKSQTLQYEAGLISTQKMIEAQMELTKMQNRIIQRKWNYKSAQLDLERRMGLWSIDDYVKDISFPLQIPLYLLPEEVEE